MSSDLRTLVTGSTVLTVSGVVTVAVGAAIVGFAVTMAGVETIGQWSIILSIAALLGVLDLGLSGTVTRFTADHRARGDDSGVIQVWVIAMSAVFCVIAISGLLVLLAQGQVQSLIQSEEQETAWWLPAIVGMQMAAGQVRGALIGVGRVPTAGALEIVASLTSLLVTVILLQYELGLTALAIGALWRGLMVSLPGAVVCWLAIGRLPVTHPSLDMLKSILRYSIPMFATVMVGVAFLNLGRLGLSAVAGVAEVGVYEAANRIALLVVAAASPVLTTALPLITARRQEDALVARATRFVQFAIGLLIGIFAGGLYIVGVPLLESWTDERSRDLVVLLGLLLLGYLLLAATGPSTVALRARGLQWIEAVSMGLGTVILVLAVVTISPDAGAAGAAAGLAIGGVVYVITSRLIMGWRGYSSTRVHLPSLALSCLLLALAASVLCLFTPDLFWPNATAGIQLNSFEQLITFVLVSCVSLWVVPSVKARIREMKSLVILAYRERATENRDGSGQV